MLLMRGVEEDNTLILEIKNNLHKANKQISEINDVIFIL
jgi:hypothetical protein